MTSATDELRKPVSGMRMWKVEKVRAECPRCGHENKIKADDLTDDELWYRLGICFWCDDCGYEFEVEVDDDDR